MNDSPAPHTKRRWYQFGRQTLLLFILAASLGLGWLGIRLGEVRKHNAAVAELKLAGATIAFDNRGRAKTVDFGCRSESVADLKDAPVLDAELVPLRALPQLEQLDLCQTRLGDAGLRQLDGLTSLKVLNLMSTRITDLGMVHLEGLTNLEQLNLMQTDITDAGLEHLQGLKNLRVLNLRASLTATVITPHVTDAGLEYLQGLTQLEELDLAFARVTDAGLVRLKKLTRLKKLNLEHVLRTFDAVRVVEGNTVRLKPARDLPTTPETVPADLITDLQQITDAGLVPLQTLTHLTSLDLTGTEVTEAGVKQLRRALPRCQIVWAPRQP